MSVLLRFSVMHYRASKTNTKNEKSTGTQTHYMISYRVPLVDQPLAFLRYFVFVLFPMSLSPYLCAFAPLIVATCDDDRSPTLNEFTSEQQSLTFFLMSPMLVIRQLSAPLVRQGNREEGSGLERPLFSASARA